MFKVAVVGMADVSAEIMERNNLTGSDVDWLVPHQANLRIIDATAERMGLDRSKVMINIDRYGNTTAATIPLCLSEWWQNGTAEERDRRSCWPASAPATPGVPCSSSGPPRDARAA